MGFTEDLSVFFPDFGDDGTLAGQPVRGIYDDAAASPQFGLGEVLAAEVVFLLPTAQVPANATGTTLVIPQGTFRVRRIELADPGLSRLFLELP